MMNQSIKKMKKVLTNRNKYDKINYKLKGKELINMKIRITEKEWTEIGKRNYANKWCKNLCSYHLEKTENDNYFRIQKMSLIPYILLFIPIHLLVVVMCLWDGGLREFEICPRQLGEDFLDYGRPREIAKEIWDKKVK